MIPARSWPVGRPLETLWTAGTFTGLVDAQLLARFLDGDGPAAEAAFRELVDRHGPMVMGVCRQVLGHRQDAEDAFQATFLVLVRKARSIRVRDSLAPWLHGVAIRTAHRARSVASRYRTDHVEPMAAAPTADGGIDPDVRPLLHEELARLPGKYRDPIVLCHLEGKSHEEAARLLAWPVGTVSGRLSRGRQLLRARLERRGVSAPSVLLATRWLTDTQVALPASIFESTVAAAARLAAAGTISASVQSLTRGVLTTMLLDQIKALSFAVVVVGAASGGIATVWTLGATGAPPAQALQDAGKTAGGRSFLAAIHHTDGMVTTGVPSEGTIAEIRVEGNTHTPAEKIKAKLLSKVGQPMDIKKIEADVKSLMRANWFSQVAVYYEGSPSQSGQYALTFAVREYPAKSTAVTPPPAAKNAPNLVGPRDSLPFFRSSSIIVAESPDRRSLQALSLEENKDWQKLALPPGVTASLLATDDTVAPSFKGEAIRQIAAFSKHIGVWRTQTLHHPAAGEVTPIILEGGAVYQVGNDVYAFSAFMGSWGAVLLEGPDKPRVSCSTKDIMVLHGNRLYVFSLKQGRFSSGIEVNPRPFQPAAPLADPVPPPSPPSQ